MPPLDPGDGVIISGCGFSGLKMPKGEVRLVGDFPAPIRLEVGWWSGGQINAKVPLALKGYKNGWVLAGYAWWWRYELNPEWGFVNQPTGFQEQAAHSAMQVSWKAMSNVCKEKRGGVSYRVDLYAIGPAGVPYK